ncbi:hypothetical protein BBF93_15960 [Hyphomonas sp. CACIAM 19H1]|uniref:hypothetical protein n=1 Tax=Hyphomonas sp. CACIAM 19H1 TaxID=1873716 RepID=UPI000DED6AF1|nr:hypothetical protein [Hyphomonas sp. CACIAM 19H1]AXE65554.1 hypothetical protein BBF93_15960 [Hyphomonas sp. CACIAM 19H1]
MSEIIEQMIVLQADCGVEIGTRESLTRAPAKAQCADKFNIARKIGPQAGKNAHPNLAKLFGPARLAAGGRQSDLFLQIAAIPARPHAAKDFLRAEWVRQGSIIFFSQRYAGKRRETSCQLGPQWDP